MFLLPYFSYIAIAMVCFGIFCSYKQYYLNADLSIEEVNSRYYKLGRYLLWAVSIVIAFFIGLDSHTYESGFHYSQQFIHGVSRVSLTDLLDVPFRSYAYASLSLFYLFIGRFVIICLFWFTIYLTDHSGYRSLGYGSEKLSTWEKVQEYIVPNAHMTRYYILTARDGAVPFLHSLALVLVLCVQFLLTLGGQQNQKFYTTGLQLNQPVLTMLQAQCANGSALYSEDTLLCDDAQLVTESVPTHHTIVVVWDVDNSAKHEVLIKVPNHKAPPIETPEESIEIAFNVLSDMNKSFMEKFASEEHKALWATLER
ncbi:hypothetical protein OTK49_00800 [Vibrio coralliirubri]|uniref:hypothetical protein n=1 Tax=Vibrio coralliirubri TaxID=1516159 RepID=UPI0022848A1F|nr:hypothetical protein [Vibrio coralliirubri]MCY9861069.1 hypothetical protein [Vibrio coralliirubri]